MVRVELGASSSNPDGKEGSGGKETSACSLRSMVRVELGVSELVATRFSPLLTCLVV